MKLYLIAGEASGDARAAEVMRALSARAAAEGQSVEYLGAGGPQMQALAPAIHDWSGEAVVGLWDVLKKYGYFRRQFHRMLDEIEAGQPDAVIFIDYPGFNLRVAKALRKRGTRARLIYYISPQVWAWNRGRIPMMARTLDLMLCIFPFEKELYEQSGLRTVFVGHPMLDSVAARRDPLAFPREPKLVGLFPGSRSREVSKIFPVMLDAARELAHRDPSLTFQAAAASDTLAATMRDMAGDFPIRVRVKESHQLMQQAAAGMVASGTATLEAACYGMPYTLLYRVAPLTWELGKRLVKVPYLGIVNLLAGREVVREFLQGNAQPLPIAEEVLALLQDDAKRTAQLADFNSVIALLGGGGAGERAAEALWAGLTTS